MGEGREVGMEEEGVGGREKWREREVGRREGVEGAGK